MPPRMNDHATESGQGSGPTAPPGHGPAPGPGNSGTRGNGHRAADPPPPERGPDTSDAPPKPSGQHAPDAAPTPSGRPEASDATPGPYPSDTPPAGPAPAGSDLESAPTSETPSDAPRFRSTPTTETAPTASDLASTPTTSTPLTETAPGAPVAPEVPEVPEVPDAADTSPGDTPPALRPRPARADDADGPAPGPRAAREQRPTALWRFVRTGRRARGARVAGCALLLAVAMTAGAVAVGGGRDAVTPAPAAAALPPGALAGGDLDAGIRALQAHLRAQPRDSGSWATLGVAYVEQARTDGDPSRYPQADRALRRSLALEPGNDPALAGRAALAAARHDFTGALNHADRALERNPYNERALSIRVDALVELGRYDEAAEAADTADDRRPGVPVFTRYAYVRELRGDVRGAREVLELALGSAATPADTAYVASSLGRLAWSEGDHGAALRHFARALAADEDYLPALEGRAAARAASGDRAGAIADLEQVVARAPLPGPLVALGELYEARGADGDRARARGQYALVDAWTALARAGGVDADLDTALAAADHGDPAEALRAARAAWDRRHSVHTADALAWALHVNGRDEEALPYARRATATGYRNAAFLYHRGMIEHATGQGPAARASLTAALGLNPGFSPLGARTARATLKDLEAAP
ncbi:tetratricopeptide repeat protein [Streptomyces sp. NPDC005931]|uniref:tetratricopeptide repeat protein n=1 Tax=Streptomyces sp. NPDC005931 TaxID=3364737 RepID=UPI00369C4D08